MNAAAWMLTGLHSPVTPGMSPQMSPSISPWASPLGSPLGSPHVSPARSHMPPPLKSPRPLDLETIPERSGQNARPAAGPRSTTQTPAARQNRIEDAHISKGDVGRPKPERSGERSDDNDEAYHTFRGEALQLTRRWQRAAHKATSAFSGMGKDCSANCI